MAISWISALKAVPWADVIEATPVLVKGARKLFKRSQEAEAAAEAPQAAPQTLAEALARLQRLEQELAGLSEQQAESAALLQSLAEQNAQLVAAMEQLRQRNQRQALLLFMLLGLALIPAGLMAWMLMR
ncbi:MAG: hypothetical protein ACK4S6_19650 [Roseateles asaccharophilus]|jgi:septal ring factor EnvC (AmiA/AmiB activator)|uniref:Uncharacterized protein n=1 Tax=Roseateles asaccharophilus TaxID=582607 RepID=A0A4R6NB55_9BURK|nr:hypothetical protein [Roseateles asaccharophilus]MDN3544873.1 hypothetical protein [Roseateles asaccharophilus]TDP12740.1 hypothetical protein DFR39_101213 [Roseateles asaccharophilus]